MGKRKTNDVREDDEIEEFLGEETRHIFDAFADTVVIMDTEGVIRHANDASHDMFGYSRGELVGARVGKLMPSPAREHHDGYVNEYLESGIAKILGVGRELIGVKSSGESFPIHLVTSELVRERDKIFVGVIRDLSGVGEAKKLRSEQRAKLANAGRLITMGELAASFAHEVNQPLASISLYAQACQRLVMKDKFDKEVAMETLQKLSDQVLRAGEIVETIQHFVKTGNEVRSQVNLNSVLAEIQYLIASDALLSDIEVVYELTPEILRVRCDAGQIQQVAVNLLRNAIEAMIQIDCRNGSQVLLSSELDGKVARVVVRDLGPGIPEEQLPFMFSAFRSTKDQGIGLGLSICKSIIEDHNGKIDFENGTDGNGCYFYFELPMEKFDASR